MQITTTSFGKDYKVHGSHNRSFDNEKLLREFNDLNIKHVDCNNEPIIYVTMRKTYDELWRPSKILSISDISDQDSSIQPIIIGYMDKLSWDIDPEQHDLIITGNYNDYGDNKFQNLERIMTQCSGGLYFEPVADDNLIIETIRPYILVGLDGFYGKYKYYL